MCAVQELDHLEEHEWKKGMGALEGRHYSGKVYKFHWGILVEYVEFQGFFDGIGGNFRLRDLDFGLPKTGITNFEWAATA